MPYFGPKIAENAAYFKIFANLQALFMETFTALFTTLDVFLLALGFLSKANPTPKCYIFINWMVLAWLEYFNKFLLQFEEHVLFNFSLKP